MIPTSTKQRKPFVRATALFVLCTFVCSMVGGPTRSYAAVAGLNLPEPGTMVNLSQAFQPLMIKGLSVHPENPLLIDFIVNTGDSKVSTDQIKTESDRLIKYFLASLAIPEDDQWVNLSPYEKDRIVPDDLGKTVLGRDMLAQDYILKQLTASLIYPEQKLGQTFWNKVYSQARSLYGTNQVPMNTFNKVWILPDSAKVYTHGTTVYVVQSHLKVMLDEDYQAMNHTVIPAKAGIQNQKEANSLGSKIVREVILPAIEQEVNTGANFTTMRQIYNSMILAVWFKNNLKEALLNQVYTNTKKIEGAKSDDAAIKEKIYQQYLEAYKKGVFNFVKEETNGNNQRIPRKYFSGGLTPINKDKISDATADEMMSAAAGTHGDNYELNGAAQIEDNLVEIRRGLDSIEIALTEAASPRSIQAVSTRYNQLFRSYSSTDAGLNDRFAKIKRRIDALTSTIDNQMSAKLASKEQNLIDRLNEAMRNKHIPLDDIVAEIIAKKINVSNEDLIDAFYNRVQDPDTFTALNAISALTRLMNERLVSRHDEYNVNYWKFKKYLLNLAETNPNNAVPNVMDRFRLQGPAKDLLSAITKWEADSAMSARHGKPSPRDRKDLRSLKELGVVVEDKEKLNFRKAESHLIRNSNSTTDRALIVDTIKKDLESSQTKIQSEIEQEAPVVLDHVLQYVHLANDAYQHARNFSDKMASMMVYVEIIQNIQTIIGLPHLVLDTPLAHQTAGEINKLWINVGNEVEMTRVNSIKDLIKNENIGNKLEARMNEAHVIFKNGQAQIEDLPPEAWSPYSSEIWAPYLIDSLVDLINKTDIKLDENNNIVLPEHIGRLLTTSVKDLVKGSDPIERLKQFVKIESDVRKDPDKGFQLAAQLQWGEVKTRKDFQEFMKDFLNATRLMKWVENWNSKKVQFLTEKNEWLLSIQNKLSLSNMDAKTLAVRILSLNIPLDIIEQVADHKMPKGDEYRKVGKKLLKKGVIRMLSMAGGSASRWKTSLDTLIKKGIIDPKEVPDNLPRALAAYWIGNYVTGGETGVTLMLNNIFSLNQRGYKASAAYVLSPYTWQPFMKATHQYFANSRQKPSIYTIAQNAGSSQVMLEGSMTGEDLSGKVLGHGNVRGWMPGIINALKNGVVIDITRSADNPFMQLNQPQTEEIAGRMAYDGLVHVALGNWRNIGQFGGGFVNQNGTPDVIDTPISKKMNSKGFIADRDINIFSAFTNFVNNAAILYAVSSPEDNLITWNDVLQVTQGREDALKNLQSKLERLNSEQIARFTTNFINLLPSEYVAKKERIDGKDVNIVQWEQISGMLHGALPKAIKQRQQKEGVQYNRNLTLAYVDISAADYKTLYGESTEGVGDYVNTFTEVKGAPDLESQMDDVARTMKLMQKRGVFSDNAMSAKSITYEPTVTRSKIKADFISISDHDLDKVVASIWQTSKHLGEKALLRSQAAELARLVGGQVYEGADTIGVVVAKNYDNPNQKYDLNASLEYYLNKDGLNPEVIPLVPIGEKGKLGDKSMRATILDVDSATQWDDARPIGKVQEFLHQKPSKATFEQWLRNQNIRFTVLEDGEQIFEERYFFKNTFNAIGKEITFRNLQKPDLDMFSVYLFRFQGKDYQVVFDKASVSANPENGGIDLNSKNLKLDAQGQKIDIQFDKAMIEQFKKGNFNGVQIRILGITPIGSVMPLLGLAPQREERLAKA